MGNGDLTIGPSRMGREASAWIIETVVSPFHCLYQDALEFHQQSHLRLVHSEGEASRLARAAFLLYLSSAEALLHQAVTDLVRPALARHLTAANRPVSLPELCRLLPQIVGEPVAGSIDLNQPPWLQFAELCTLRVTWVFPGGAGERRAYYRSAGGESSFDPLQPHEVPSELGLHPSELRLPRTGLPRDPYALRPFHVDAVRGILDAVIEALDRAMGGRLTLDGRHRREPVRVVHPAMPPQAPAPAHHAVESCPQ
jgi:hypothetical protein